MNGELQMDIGSQKTYGYFGGAILPSPYLFLEHSISLNNARIVRIVVQGLRNTILLIEFNKMLNSFVVDYGCDLLFPRL